MTCRRGSQAWWQDKSNTHALHDAREGIRPVLAQLIKSNYIFMFGLHLFSMRRFQFVIEYLITWCHRAAAKEDAASWAARSWASSIGPSVNECTRLEPGPTYGASVLERAIEHPRGDWDTRLRLYSEGLLTGHWTVLDEQIQTNSEPVGESGRVRFGCPASIVFGLRDPALDYRICVKRVEDLFLPAKGRNGARSHVILIEDCGHWSPLEMTGFTVLSELLLEVMTETTNVPIVPTKNSAVRRSSFGA